MKKPICAALCVAALILCHTGKSFAQDEELPYNSLLEKSLKGRKGGAENRALRDLGGVPMEKVVRIPAEVKKDIAVIQKASAKKEERPVIFLVYGQKAGPGPGLGAGKAARTE